MYKEIHKKIIKFKKDLDKIAEPGWREEKTVKYVVDNLGVPMWRSKTALVYSIGRGDPVFFRTELDALAGSSGAKHLCGHSLHTASLMGAYLYFKDHLPKRYRIYFVFQPAEEVYPSGADFIFKSFKPLKSCRAGFAFHVMPGLPAGNLYVSEFASGDYFEIKVSGRSVHIKDRNISEGGDALLAGSEIVKMVNGARKKSFIANVGNFKGGDVANRIAGLASLIGDVRAMSEQGRAEAERFLREVCLGVPKRFKQIKIDLKYFKTYPPLVSDKVVAKKLNDILDIKGVYRSFATEDFSLYKVPKVMLTIGTGSNYELHSENFEVDSKIALGVFENWVKIGESDRFVF